MKLIRDMRGGKDYDSTWGTRMKGTGPYAWMIGRRFETACEQARPQQAQGGARPPSISARREPRAEQLSLFGMTTPSPKLTAVTLGVRDVPASARFYEALGFKRKVRATGDEIAFFEAGGVVLALWDWDKLAERRGDCRRSPGRRRFAARRSPGTARRRPRSMRFWRRRSAVGAELLRRPEKTDYGGYRGYFADPDGHVWEVVQAPGFAFTDDGRLILPD